MMTPEQIERALDRLLLSVEKPGRYVGGEYNSVVKDWGQVPFRVAMAFPDIYDLGMSNLGLMLLYDAINRQPDMLAERVFNPWVDMETVMRQEGIPLYGMIRVRLWEAYNIPMRQCHPDYPSRFFFDPGCGVFA